MLSGIPSQMIDTCYGENRMKISRPYPEKKIVEIRCTNQFATIFGKFLFPSRYCMHCLMHIVQSQTLVTHKTVNARVSSTLNLSTVQIDVTGNKKSKMAAAKPEVRLT